MASNLGVRPSQHDLGELNLSVYKRGEEDFLQIVFTYPMKTHWGQEGVQISLENGSDLKDGDFIRRLNETFIGMFTDAKKALEDAND